MKRLLSLLGLMLVVAIVFTSCKKKENTTQTPLVEDGYYLVGGSAPVDSMVLKNMLDQGYVEGDGFSAQPMDGLFQKYVYLTQNGGGFIIKQQAGAQTITWGIDGDWTQVRGDTVMKAAIKQDGGVFSVPKDGLYLVVVNFPKNMLYMLRVEKWSVIGDATAGGWSDDSQQELTQASLDANGGEWKITNLGLKPMSIKFRFNHWWTYYQADTNAEANGDPKFFTNLGGSLDNLTPGGANISIDNPAFYTLTLDYVYGDKFTATLEKTGDMEATDFSQHTFSFIGDAIGQNNDTTNLTSWNYDLDLQYVGVDDYVYKFKYDGVLFATNKYFKIRMDHDWGTNWGYEDVNLQGNAKDNFEPRSKGNDFHVINGGAYNVQFAINGFTYQVDLTIDNAKK